MKNSRFKKPNCLARSRKRRRKSPLLLYPKKKKTSPQGATRCAATWIDSSAKRLPLRRRENQQNEPPRCNTLNVLSMKLSKCCAQPSGKTRAVDPSSSKEGMRLCPKRGLAPPRQNPNHAPSPRQATLPPRALGAPPRQASSSPQRFHQRPKQPRASRQQAKTPGWRIAGSNR